ncbi:hypothetical protein M1D93_18010 [Arthrobacter sp. Z1-9]
MSDTAGSRRNGSVDQLLLEADLGGDTQLRPVLLELRALGSAAPEPSAELLALMAGTNVAPPVDAELAEDAIAAAAPQTDVSAVEPAARTTEAAAVEVLAVEVPAPATDELAARRRAKRRITLTALSVAVSLGAGGAVAAASDQSIRDSFTQLNQVVTSFITGSGEAPADTPGEQPSMPLPTMPAGAAPAGTSSGSPTSIPSDPAAVAQPTAAPSSNGLVAPETADGQRTSPGEPGEVPASETLPGAVPGHIADGLGGSPEVPVPPQVPLPATLPAVPLP